MTLSETLKEHAFTAGLSDIHVARLTPLACPVRFGEDDLVLRAGEHSRYFYLLLSGSMCVEARNQTCTVFVQALGPGEAFGWSSLLDNHDTLFQVRAREPSSALRLDGAGLAAVLKDDPELAANLLLRTLNLVAGRVQATEVRLGELCGMRMSERR